MKYLTILCLLLTPLTTPAQYRDGLMWVASSGLSFPISPDTFADRWKSGFHIGGGVLYGLNLEQRVMVRTTASYQKLSPNTNQFLLDQGITNTSNRITVQSGSGSIWSLALNLKITPRGTEGRIIPYAIGGPALMRITQNITYVPQGSPQSQQFKETTSNMGWSLGLGLDFDMRSTLTLFAESQYTMVFSDQAGPRFIPIRMGILF